MITSDEPNDRIVLARYPSGYPTPEDFRQVSDTRAELGDGEVAYRTEYLSIDPFIRARLAPGPSYAAATAIGETVSGLSSGYVSASRNPNFRVGDAVVGPGGWQTHPTVPGAELRKLDGSAPTELRGALGWLGMPGLTAYVGLLDLARAAPGETVLVSSAAGTVGAMAGQIARIRGCHVIGIAGGAEKCSWVTETLGFDACLDYQDRPDLRVGLRQACPQGVDVYFDNVGGDILAAAIDVLNVHARVVLCGMVSAINAEGPITNRQDLRPLFVKRASVLPILVSDHWTRFPDFLADARSWSESGLVAVREEVVDGLAEAPDALRRLLTGQIFGKLLIRCVSAPLSLSQSTSTGVI